MNESWQHRKARMQVSVSNAEMLLDIELVNRELDDYCFRGYLIFLDNGEIMAKEKVKTEEVRRRPWTLPDKLFILPYMNESTHRPLPVYLDGSVHRRRGVKNRDDKIDNALHKLGFKPLRFSYGEHLSGKYLKEICDTIEDELVSQKKRQNGFCNRF